MTNLLPDNPLLENPVLPPFSAIRAEHVEPAVQQLLQECREGLQRVLANTREQGVSWETLVAPLEEQDDRLNKAWSPVSHLHGVLNSDALRQAYNNSLSLLTAYSTEVGQNRDLYEAYQALADSPGFAALPRARRTVVEHALRDFRLAGVDLPETEKQEYARLKQRLSELSTEFGNRVLDATQGWYKQLDEAGQLAGLPDSALALARQAAEQKGVSGYVVTLDVPAYLAVMMYADNRALREEVYTAYTTRASELGRSLVEGEASQWDNTPLMEEILALRHRLAQLLGFDNYAERSLATKMAESCDQVEAFLLELAEKSRPAAEQDYAELRDFARRRDGVEDFQAWDQAYYSEKLRQEKYALSQEALRPYFPASKVVSGMFEVVGRLFGIEFVETPVDVWHPDVRYYQVQQGDDILAGFYLDLYARENKRGGAWMDECRVRRRTGAGELQLPVAYLTCNFTPAVNGKPALLTHDEVLTLFHEFGHGLHHMLTRVDTAAVSGINGVAWDAVELPSQFLENWCWERAAIPLISGHFETGEPLPADMLDNLLAARNFQSALQLLRQIEFSLFDFRLHRQYDPQQPRPVQAVLDEVRDQVAVSRPPAFNRFQNSFTHIFAGGYAAGYYSYKWAEVLSSDAFACFEEEGVFNRDTGERFLTAILQQGGSRDAMELFKQFRGREPSTEALLRHTGIAA